MLSLCVGHDAVHGPFKSTGGEGHHFIQDTQRQLFPAFNRPKREGERAKSWDIYLEIVAFANRGTRDIMIFVSVVSYVR